MKISSASRADRPRCACAIMLVLLDRLVKAGGGEVFLLVEVVHHRRRHEVDLRRDVGERHAAHPLWFSTSTAARTIVSRRWWNL